MEEFMSEEAITYEEAKKAKEVLLKYLEQNIGDYISLDDIKRSYKTEYLVWIALNDSYFLD